MLLLFFLIPAAIIGATVAPAIWLRTAGKPAAVALWCLVLWLIALCWAGLVIDYRNGGLPSGDVFRTGTASIQSCRRDWVSFSFTSSCSATFEWGTPVVADDPVILETSVLTGRQRLAGSVTVNEVCANGGGRSSPGSCTVVPASYRLSPDHAWAGVLLFVVGVLVGWAPIRYTTRQSRSTSAGIPG